MKESRQYLSFFKKNILIILIPMLVAPLSYFFILERENKIVTITRLVEFSTPDKNLADAELLTDQAVKLLRSENLKQELKINSKVSIYKYAPAVLSLEVSGIDAEQAKGDLSKLSRFTESRYLASALGRDSEKFLDEKIYSYLTILAGAGFLTGVIFSLAKSYFQNF
jgi:hypothetical protein